MKIKLAPKIKRTLVHVHINTVLHEKARKRLKIVGGNWRELFDAMLASWLGEK